MARFTKFNFIGSFLSLMLLGSSAAFTLTSCNQDADEPKWDEEEVVTHPEKEEDETGNETPENPDDNGNTDDNTGDDNTGDDNNGDDNTGGNSDEWDAVPEAFAANYNLGYVVMPDGTPEQVKEYTSYILSFNKDNHTANYVSWELLASETKGNVDRNKFDFWQDTSLSGCSSTNYEYSKYSYQRGHMCPAADNKWSEAAMKDCMSMANMCPQYASLNEKIWATLENKTRNWAQSLGSVWVVCGPFYSADDTQRIGTSNVRVPSAYFKAFLYYDGEDSQAIAYVFANTSNPGNLNDYAMSIDALEELMKVDFFSALPDKIEKAVEANYDTSFWK